jgi:hypothetical protein
VTWPGTAAFVHLQGARSIWPAWVRLVRQNIASSQPMLAILHSLNVIAVQVAVPA